MYRAKILCYSVGADCQPLMTAEMEYPRFLIAETATHRALQGHGETEVEVVCHPRTTTDDMSKSSASSRAIPIKRMIEKVEADPYIPERFGKAGPGMQAHGWLEGEDHERAKEEWQRSCFRAVQSARWMMDLGCAKQTVNRILEPFSWVTQILTATDSAWNNFYALRCHGDADPALSKVVRMLYKEHRKSTPTKLRFGQWHLPFIDPQEAKDFTYYPPLSKESSKWGEPVPDLIQFSAARCAWASYSLHDRPATPEQMKSTFNKLVGSAPVHPSPCEHQATPMGPSIPEMFRSNLTGYYQARKLLKNERIDVYNPPDEVVEGWELP